MPAVKYTEEVFSIFYIHAIQERSAIDLRDFSAIMNFQEIISQNLRLTENQARYIVKLLKKYQNVWQLSDVAIIDLIDNPKWRQEFRKIDLTKEVFIETDEENVPWICLRFPYTLKKEFEDTILQVNEGFFGNFFDNQYWDRERKLRKLNLYNYNLIQIQDFVQKHNFVIDETFVEAINVVDDIWSCSQYITKRSKISQSRVELINADHETEEFFKKNQKNLISDLLLAKSMGFLLDQIPTNAVETISATDENWFWYRNLKNLLEILKNIDGKIVFILDRVSDYQQWTKTFKNILDEVGIADQTKVCFRENNQENPDFNRWVADSGLGGRVNDGKFLIFLHRPNKWLFNHLNDVKVIVTNSIYPPTDQIAKHFLQSHPCVIFVGDVKPTDSKERKIVSL